MSNDKFYPNAISHKVLNNLLNKAKKEISTIDTFEKQGNKENQKFNDLITDWTKTSQKILLMLNKKDQFSTKNIDHKSLLAFGAMGAHINMALLALKATGTDQ